MSGKFGIKTGKVKRKQIKGRKRHGRSSFFLRLANREILLQTRESRASARIFIHPWDRYLIFVEIFSKCPNALSASSVVIKLFLFSSFPEHCLQEAGPGRNRLREVRVRRRSGRTSHGSCVRWEVDQPENHTNGCTFHRFSIMSSWFLQFSFPLLSDGYFPKRRTRSLMCQLEKLRRAFRPSKTSD